MTEFNGTANENNKTPEIKAAKVENTVASGNDMDEVVKRIISMNMTAEDDDEGKRAEKKEAKSVAAQPNIPIIAAKPIVPAQSAAAAQPVPAAVKPEAEVQSAPAAVKPEAAVQSAPTAVKPEAAAQPVPAAVKPEAEVQSAPAEAKPVATVQSAPSAVKPEAAVQSVPAAAKPAAAAQPAPAAAKPAAKTEAAAQPTLKPIKIDESSFSNAVAFDAEPEPKPTAPKQPAPAMAKPAATSQSAPAAAKPAATSQSAPAAAKPEATSQSAPAAVVKPAATVQPAPAAVVKPAATAQPAPAAVIKPTATAQPVQTEAQPEKTEQPQQATQYTPYTQPYTQNMTPVAPINNQMQYYGGNPQAGGYPAPAYQQPFTPYYGYQQPPVPAQQQYDLPVPQPQMPMKKKNYGAFLYVTMIVLLMGFFIWLLYDYGSGKIVIGNNNSSSSYSDENSDTPSDTDSGTASSGGIKPIETDDGDGIDPDGPTITLNAIDERSEYSARAAFKRTNPSVVSVLVFENDKKMEKDFTSEGSGVIISANGYIVTNSHVIMNSKNQHGVQVVLADETVYNAKVVGFDTRTDLAVLKINATKLAPANFADSDLVEIGEDVIALGNPGGIEFSHSLTKGIVSAVNRSVSTDNYVKYIQTDAAINPGNSGGPLLNLHGQVLGINTIKIVDEQYEGMGFAIPSRVVKSIVDDLITKGYVQNRVRLGIKGQAIDLITAEKYGVKGGISIIEFTDDSAFAGSTAQLNDVIIKLGDTDIDCFATLYEQLENYKPGDKVTITVYRPSEKKTVDVTITLLADTGQTQN